ncbi:MAG: hypothetical protein M3386_02570 [Actinomycetota bacterium]|nr:hypothetical protein [Actinomycetota bacterium]
MDDEEIQMPPEGLTARTEARLSALDESPVDQHVPIYDAVHRDLCAALGSETSVPD